jgi:hypothetical protein
MLNEATAVSGPFGSGSDEPVDWQALTKTIVAASQNTLANGCMRDGMIQTFGGKWNLQ